MKNDFLTKNIRPQKIVVKRGLGAIFSDQNGKQYLDLSSQTLNLNLGYNHPKIIKALAQELESPIFISSRFGNETLTKLAKKLISIAPKELAKINLKLTNGSDANESAFKRARKYHQKHFIVSFHKTHLGESSETLAASGGHFGKPYLGGSNNFIFINPPFKNFYSKSVTDYESESLGELEDLLRKRKDIAGLILEPIMVNAGVYVFPKRYLQKLRRICSKHHIALIFDEIQTAFGWLGCLLVSAKLKVTPDMLTLGKALSSGLPLAAILLRKDYDVLDYGEDEYTYGGHPLSCTTALANLKVLTTTNILQQVKEKASILKKELLYLQKTHPAIIEVRGMGLIYGVELDKWKEKDGVMAERVYRLSMENGLILRKSENGNGNSLVFKPPLVISQKQLSWALETFEEIIKKCYAGY